MMGILAIMAVMVGLFKVKTRMGHNNRNHFKCQAIKQPINQHMVAKGLLDSANRCFLLNKTMVGTQLGQLILSQ